ncbi:MAG: VWA domain-containing protein [Bacteroidetes bacterium]|nr:MAG: VWA domain-containing protein [Bacteroidota bacterium]
MNRNLPMVKEASPKAIESFYQGELAPNAEMKCPLVLVLDRSSSMQGAPIKELNRGLKIFQTQIQNDEVAAARLEVAVVTFASDVKIDRDFSLFENTAIPTIEAYGNTDMASGIQEAILRVEARKAWYKEQGLQYYRPYIVLMTDGCPTSDERSIEFMKEQILQGVKGKRFNFWAFGVENADMEFLHSLSPEGFHPQKLKGINFADFFRWLSSSFSAITSSKPDDTINIAPKPDENPFQITVY